MRAEKKGLSAEDCGQSLNYRCHLERPSRRDLKNLGHMMQGTGRKEKD